MHEIDIENALKLCVELPMLVAHLRRVGLHKTANRVQDAVEEIVDELAAYIEAERKAHKDKKE